ncbi:MAG: hypothetical protein V1663_02695 [archaeon]
MANIYIIPNWFLGYDILLEVVFAVVTLLVALYAYKVYKFTEQRQSKLFALSFFLISISYLIQSILNFLILNKLNDNICTMLQIKSVTTLNLIGIYTHIFFFIAGLIVLTYTTLKIKDTRVLSLLFILSFLSLIFSLNKINLFYILSSIFFVYISLYYLFVYLKTKHTKNLLVLIAFIFLLFAHIHFIFSLTYGSFYVIAHLLEFIAYLLILIDLILVLKK